MACEWSKAMGEEGLCEEVIEAILKMGFKRKASFAHAFVDSNVFEDWLTRFKLKLVSSVRSFRTPSNGAEVVGDRSRITPSLPVLHGGPGAERWGRECRETVPTGGEEKKCTKSS